MEALGQLTGGIAQDFNDVLQLIGGHLQLLRVAHRTHEPTIRRLDAATDGIRRGAGMAAQLLAFARRQRLTPAVLRIDALLRGMEDTLRQALGGRGLNLSIDAADALVLLDQVEFGNTMLHLVRNAAEAMAPGGELAIEVAPGRLPGTTGEECLRIRLADNGAGMTEEVQRRAFEPFFSTKAGSRRSGVGLSLAFGFVKQSGGHIELSSTPGTGTVVTLYFPLVEAQDPAQTAAHIAAPSAAPAPTVLVVEDEAAVREASVEVLRKLGLCVLEAADGETALGLIRQKLPIDLLFTDILMPGATRGQDLALAAAEYLPQAKVLFASGYPGDVGDEDIFRRVPLLQKPYRLDEMARLVRRMLATGEE
jgi:CheY-like chemotaxis protein